MPEKVTRRQFVRNTAGVAAGVATGLASSRAAGANDRIRVGVIGAANRGGQLIEATLPQNDAEIVAVCDVYEPIRRKWADQLGVDTYNDYREMIERKDLDGVIIATPDHWHALQMIDACDAGLDVFVEKPLSITILEGRKMIEAARRNNRIAQVGTHRRSGKFYMWLYDYMRTNPIGKVTVARTYRLSNMYPSGMGRAPEGDPPEGLDWDMWLGPRPERPFQATIAPYKFRWWHLYSSQLGNWGVHYFDLMRWMLNEEAPVSVSAHGGRFAVEDDRTVPDTLETVYEFASGRLMIFGQYEASGNRMFPHGEVEFRGTQGTLYADWDSMRIIPERGGQFQDPKPRMKRVEKETDGGNGDQLHIRNWLDCVKSRNKPTADIEDGHRSTVFSHLGNIALATKSRIEWDATTEKIVNNREANKLLHYDYRAPWKLR